MVKVPILPGAILSQTQAGSILSRNGSIEYIFEHIKPNLFENLLIILVAEAAREFLAIPASEVSVERLFSAGRDLLGIRRLSLGADTMRMLMLMKDIV
jgi:hypothetical protein